MPIVWNYHYGELPGWVLGWALILEYVLAVAAVSTGWSAYFGSLLGGFGIHIPTAISGSFNPSHGTYIIYSQLYRLANRIFT